MKFRYSISFIKTFVSVMFLVLITVSLSAALYFKIYYFLFVAGVYLLLLTVFLRNEFLKYLYYNKNGVVFIDYENNKLMINSYNKKETVCIDFDKAIVEKNVIEFLQFGFSNETKKHYANIIFKVIMKKIMNVIQFHVKIIWLMDLNYLIKI